MFIGNFTTLDGVYTYFILNSHRLQILAELKQYFKEYNDYDYSFVLEYLSDGVYSLTCGFNIIHFDMTHILSHEEVISFLTKRD